MHWQWQSTDQQTAAAGGNWIPLQKTKLPDRWKVLKNCSTEKTNEMIEMSLLEGRLANALDELKI